MVIKTTIQIKLIIIGVAAIYFCNGQDSENFGGRKSWIEWKQSPEQVCPCQDVPPPGKWSCQQQKDFGKCDKWWMLWGDFCTVTCGRCKCSDQTPEPQNPSLENCQCTDISPPGSDLTCQQQSKWGKCEADWMQKTTDDAPQGYCQLSCGRCDCPGAPIMQQIIVPQAPMQIVGGKCMCSDIQPRGSQFTCEEQKQLGKCNADWMFNTDVVEGYCQMTCGRCPCETEQASLEEQEPDANDKQEQIQQTNQDTVISQTNNILQQQSQTPPPQESNIESDVLQSASMDASQNVNQNISQLLGDYYNNEQSTNDEYLQEQALPPEIDEIFSDKYEIAAVNFNQLQAENRYPLFFQRVQPPSPVILETYQNGELDDRAVTQSEKIDEILQAEISTYISPEDESFFPILLGSRNFFNLDSPQNEEDLKIESDFTPVQDFDQQEEFQVSESTLVLPTLPYLQNDTALENNESTEVFVESELEHLDFLQQNDFFAPEEEPSFGHNIPNIFPDMYPNFENLSRNEELDSNIDNSLEFFEDLIQYDIDQLNSSLQSINSDQNNQNFEFSSVPELFPEEGVIEQPLAEESADEPLEEKFVEAEESADEPLEEKVQSDNIFDNNNNIFDNATNVEFSFASARGQSRNNRLDSQNSEQDLNFSRSAYENLDGEDANANSTQIDLLSSQYNSDTDKSNSLLEGFEQYNFTSQIFEQNEFLLVDMEQSLENSQNIPNFILGPETEEVIAYDQILPTTVFESAQIENQDDLQAEFEFVPIVENFSSKQNFTQQNILNNFDLVSPTFEFSDNSLQKENLENEFSPSLEKVILDSTQSDKQLQNQQNSAINNIENNSNQLFESQIQPLSENFESKFESFESPQIESIYQTIETSVQQTFNQVENFFTQPSFTDINNSSKTNNNSQRKNSECTFTIDQLETLFDVDIFMQLVSSPIEIQDAINNIVQFPVTIMVTNDDGFENFFKDNDLDIEFLLSDPQFTLSTIILPNVMIDGAISSDELEKGMDLQSIIQGHSMSTIDHSTWDGIRMIDQQGTESVFIQTDIQICQATIHVVDTLHLPKINFQFQTTAHPSLSSGELSSQN